MKTIIKPLSVLFTLCNLFVPAFAGIPQITVKEVSSAVLKIEVLIKSDDFTGETSDFDTRIILNISSVEKKKAETNFLDIRPFIKPEKEVDEPDILGLIASPIAVSQHKPIK